MFDGPRRGHGTTTFQTGKPAANRDFSLSGNRRVRNFVRGEFAGPSPEASQSSGRGARLVRPRLRITEPRPSKRIGTRNGHPWLRDLPFCRRQGHGFKPRPAARRNLASTARFDAIPGLGARAQTFLLAAPWASPSACFLTYYPRPFAATCSPRDSNRRAGSTLRGILSGKI